MIKRLVIVLTSLSCASALLGASIRDIQRVNDYNDFVRVSSGFPQLDTATQKSIAIKAWELYSRDMQKVSAFYSSDLKSLLSKKVRHKDHEYIIWRNALNLVKNYNELQEKVFPKIPNDTNSDVKSLIAKTSWIMFITPLVSDGNYQTITNFALRSAVQPVPNSKKRSNPSAYSFRKCFRTAHRFVHISSILVNVVSNAASSIRQIQYSRSINSANQFFEIAGIFAPSITRVSLIVNKLFERKIRAIPPIQYLALGLQLTDLAMDAIEMYMEER